jgi:hypothetical protein
MANNTHKRGRPKGSTNKKVSFPVTIDVPEGWTEEITRIRQTRLYQTVGAGIRKKKGEVDGDEYSVFKLFWTDKIEEKLVTNQKEKINGKHPVRYDKERTFSKDELEKFLLVGLIMCLNSRHEYTQHWEKNELNENPIIQRLLPLRRFQTILQNLHPHTSYLQDTLNTNFQAY